MEENDLFPYALEALPSDSWDHINQAGQDDFDIPVATRITVATRVTSRERAIISSRQEMATTP